MKCVWLVALGLLTAALTAGGTLEVKADKENVVASRLCGKWVTEPKLSQRLTAVAVDRETPSGNIEFTSDAAVAGKVPEKYMKFLKDKLVYLLVTVKLERKHYPFILIEHCGNPHVVWFRERDGEPMGDAESFNVMLAVAKNPADDLLFVGGDFNNAPFRALERAERREAK